MNKSARQIVRTGAAFALGLAGVLSTAAALAETSTAPPAASTQSAMPAKSMRHETHKQMVEKLQTALVSHGYKLEVDGKLGPQTRSAILDYQTKHGLKATGKADKQTLDSLGVA